MPKTLIIDDDIPDYMINDFKNMMEKELMRQHITKMNEGIKIFLNAQKEAEKQQREAKKQQRDDEKQQREAEKQQREAKRDLKMTMTERKARRKAKEKQQMEEVRLLIEKSKKQPK